jgi:hypothetical protein
VPIGSDTTDDALFVLGSKRSEGRTQSDGELLVAIGELHRHAPVLVSLKPALKRSSFIPLDPAPAMAKSNGREADPAPWVSRNARWWLLQSARAAARRCCIAVAVPRLLGGRYEIERRLAVAAWAVYAAFDGSLDRRVAAKIIRVDLIGLPVHGRALSARSASPPPAHPTS